MATYAKLYGETFIEWVEYEVLPPHRQGSLRPQVIDAIPAFDPATQKVVPASPIVEPTQVRKTWVVVPLTADELTFREIGVDLENARQVYTALKNSTGTDANRLRRVETVLAGVLRYIAHKERLSVV